MRVLGAGFLVLVVNSAYLFARADATAFYFANVVLHIVLGIVLAVAAGWQAPKAAPVRSWPKALLVAAVLLGLGAVTGIALTVVGATRPWAWLLRAHIVTTGLGALVVAVWAAAAALRRPASRDRMGTLAGLGVAAAVVLATGVVIAKDRREAPDRFRIVNPALPPTSMEGEGMGPNGPFFPSSSETNVGGIIPANFFMTSQACARCHKEIYDQWNSSAHHFSSFNNQWYRKSIEYMQDVVGTTPSKWCAGCHDHAVFFNGRFDRPIKEQINTPEAQAGLSCTSCHSIVHVKSTMGQGDFTIEYPPLHDLAASTNPLLEKAHDFLIRTEPEPHKKTFMKPFHQMQTAQFCSSCHKVHLDVPVNSYRWFRGFNDYDNWQASGVSGEGARSFYYPAKPQKCTDCHMPLVPAPNDPAAKNGMVKSHRFPAANTALPFVNGDEEQLRITQKFLQDGQVTVDVFGLARVEEEKAGGAGARAGAEAAQPQIASTFAQGEEAGNLGSASVVLSPPVEVIAPLDVVAPTVRRGESVRLEVVVRTRKVGHFFPGGTVDAFDVWVELEAVDDKGRTILHSGRVEPDGRGGNGPVDPAAHRYQSLLLDANGNPINKRNAWMARSVAYVRLIPPGAADTVHYRLRVPEDAGDTIRLKAKVNYRKFAWWNTQWAFGGIRDPEHKGFSVAKDHDDGRWVFTGDTSGVSGKVKTIPDIPITVMATAEATLKVAPKGAPLPADQSVMNPKVRERWNDYGIGLLLQGDLKGAEAAFLKVTQMDPAYADGWVNVARAQIQEGNMADAETFLEKALELDPGLAKTHFFMAMTLKARGEYDKAIEHLRAAADTYPKDRVVRNQLGRLLFLKRQYDAAIAELQKVLEIDPEDLQAHYNLMLSWQGKGDAEKARHAEALYKRFKADESAQFITGPYRKLHPHDNNERQSIHEHGQWAPWVPPAAPEKKPYGAGGRIAAGGGGR
jgi:tetratricopeptide (TPR) repeat protein